VAPSGVRYQSKEYDGIFPAKMGISQNLVRNEECMVPYDSYSGRDGIGVLLICILSCHSKNATIDAESFFFELGFCCVWLTTNSF